ERPALIVASREPVGEAAAIAADVDVSLPVGIIAAELARLASDRIVDAGTLERRRELGAKPVQHARQRSIHGQRRIIAAAATQVAGRIEADAVLIDDQDPVLQLADQVLAELELEQAVAE